MIHINSSDKKQDFKRKLLVVDLKKKIYNDISQLISMDYRSLYHF